MFAYLGFRKHLRYDVLRWRDEAVAAGEVGDRLPDGFSAAAKVAEVAV